MDSGAVWAEKLSMGYRRDHTFTCLSAAGRRDVRTHEDIRCSLIGNSFHCPTVALLLGSWAHQHGLIPEAPSPQTIVDWDVSSQALKSRQVTVESSEKQLIRFYVGCQTHRGGAILQRLGPNGGLPAVPQMVDARQWRWKNVISAKWKLRGEHINALEARAYVLSLRWRARQRKMLHSRFLHLVDSQVTLGAMSKGRSSTRRLRFICKQAAAIQLAGGLFPILGFTRSHTNPADRPSRQFTKAARSAKSTGGLPQK